MSKSSHAVDSVYVPRSQHYKGPFGRLFRELPPWSPPSRDPVMAEAAIPQFAADQMSEAESEDDLDNTNLPARYTCFGHSSTMTSPSTRPRRSSARTIPIGCTASARPGSTSTASMARAPTTSPSSTTRRAAG